MEYNEKNNSHTINADHPHSKEHYCNPEHHPQPKEYHSDPEHHPNLKGNHPKEVDHHGH